jgi:hypothetical protein
MQCSLHHLASFCRPRLYSILHQANPVRPPPPTHFILSFRSHLPIPNCLLPNSKPPLHPPPPDTVLANIVPRILNVLLTPLLGLPNSLQPILLPLLDLILLLQPLFLHNLRLVRDVHPVDFDEAAGRLVRVAEELFARGHELAVDGLGHEIHVPGGNCKGNEYALLRKLELAWCNGSKGCATWMEEAYHGYPKVNNAVV